jgi:hypothetical protein
MRKEIKKILEDIYLIDDSLKMQEEELIKVIQELLYSKPDSKINPDFVKRLKVILKQNNPKKTMFNIFNKQFVYAFVGVIALVCIIGLSLLFINKDQVSEVALIKDLGKNAFGDIQFAQGLEDRNSDVAIETQETYGLGGGKEESLTMPAPDSITYKYVYKGEDFDLIDNEVIVYRIAKDNSLTDSLKNVLNGVSLNGINLNSFNNVKVVGMEIAEDREYGYSMYIDTRNNTIYINMNWEKWPVQVYEERVVSSDESLYQENIISISDEEAISIANSFISKFGVDMTMYQEGEVMKYGGGGLMNPNPTVVYPLQIEGQTVYDESGQKYGIYVSIDSNQKMVTNVSNINVSSFESSAYDVEMTKEEVIKIAEQGGVYRSYYISDNVVEIELGTPTIELVKIWRMSDDKYNGEELFVPSLIFPIINNSDFYRNSVIVPLIGGMAENVIMPMYDMEEESRL